MPECKFNKKDCLCVTCKGCLDFQAELVCVDCKSDDPVDRMIICTEREKIS